ncbi:flagellar hook protein FlgE [Notoacmeibacter sp. MSK16QG-6]|uniref:flagellar hook protein FlgE n=1 Tax=Notoacmeibacter sp. MSK16QG-6 TaxID=2957982 RepID=UPI0020A06664|nr:flagellar hook protein FlgE [Notoacmeibacter sp. MSK16QG-6]MCP1200935.1 flagellar hook protein FlgE [Notoacmeibacter sp. MSK16QG-6]
MSIFGTMQTSISGMNAQSSRLSSVADNIANSDTPGYKRQGINFATLVTGAGNTSGGVITTGTIEVEAQGVPKTTSSSTDLAILGHGFFLVSDGANNGFMTRAGAFTQDADGYLVNPNGYRLQGYSMASGVAPVPNGLAGLVDIQVSKEPLPPAASTFGTFQATLDSQADIESAAVTANTLPSDNVVGATFTGKTSMVAYESLGNEVRLDVYVTRTATDTWEVSVYNQADANSSLEAFPYGNPALGTTNLQFDTATGALTGASPTSLTVPVPNGASLQIDLSEMKLGGQFTVTEAEVNGNPPSSAIGTEISDEGIVRVAYEDGSYKDLFMVALADVPSPTNLTPVTGTMFTQSANSGDIQVGFPGSSGFGTIISSSLEQSNVDIAEELTEMIQAQRSYTANSKVFQTGSEIMDVVVNLKR